VKLNCQSNFTIFCKWGVSPFATPLNRGGVMAIGKNISPSCHGKKFWQWQVAKAV